MKQLFFKTMLALSLIGVSIFSSSAQQVPAATLQNNPWKTSELLQPSALAAMINSGNKLRIYNIGVVQDIKGAVNVGAASKKENLEKFNKTLKGLPKDEVIVVYCGCCPMGKCPNIRPAFQLLKDQKFTRVSLLNLTTNLKTDWVNKGYPLEGPSK